MGESKFQCSEGSWVTKDSAGCSQVVLADHLAPDDEDADAVAVFLERQVEAAVKKALLRHSSPKAPKLPLIRLRVWPIAVKHSLGF